MRFSLCISAARGKKEKCKQSTYTKWYSAHRWEPVYGGVWVCTTHLSDNHNGKHVLLERSRKKKHYIYLAWKFRCERSSRDNGKRWLRLRLFQNTCARDKEHTQWETGEREGKRVDYYKTSNHIRNYSGAATWFAYHFFFASFARALAPINSFGMNTVGCVWFCSRKTCCLSKHITRNLNWAYTVFFVLACWSGKNSTQHKTLFNLNAFDQPKHTHTHKFSWMQKFCLVTGWNRLNENWRFNSGENSMKKCFNSTKLDSFVYLTRKLLVLDRKITAEERESLFCWKEESQLVGSIMSPVAYSTTKVKQTKQLFILLLLLLCVCVSKQTRFGRLSGNKMSTCCSMRSRKWAHTNESRAKGFTMCSSTHIHEKNTHTHSNIRKHFYSNRCVFRLLSCFCLQFFSRICVADAVAIQKRHISKQTVRVFVRS